MIARGYLEGTVEISEITIPFIQASEVALTQAIAEAESDAGDEDDDDEEDEDDE
jgi:hypothetical protein